MGATLALSHFVKLLFKRFSRPFACVFFYFIWFAQFKNMILKHCAHFFHHLTMDDFIQRIFHFIIERMF